MISLSNVSKVFDHGMGVQEVSLDIEPGDTVLLVGRGKSTLCSLLSGAAQPSHGEVMFFDQPVHRLTRASLAALRRRLGIVKQTCDLLPDRSALENVALPLQVNQVPSHDIRIRSAAALAKVNFTAQVDSPVAWLSASDVQRVMLARALVCEPDILIADEPLSSCGESGDELLLDLAGQRKEQGKVTIIASNRPTLASIAALADWRTVELVSAKVPASEVGDADEFLVEEVYDEIVFDNTELLEPPGRVVPFPIEEALRKSSGAS